LSGRGFTATIISVWADTVLDDLRSAPGEDAARLVWADAIGGERGELVVLQIDLARGGLTARETIARRKRQRVLLARHGAAWSGLEGIARRVSFARGFVDAAEIPAPLLLEYAGEIAYAAPLLSSVTVTELSPALLARVVAHPFVHTLRGLELSFDGALAAAIRAGRLSHLRAFGCHDRRIGILDARSLQHLEHLSLGSVDADAVHALRMAGGLPVLRSLHLGPRCSLAQVASLIPPTVTELIAPGTDNLAVLARTPLAATIERLEIGDDLDPRDLAAFPKLCSLYVGGVRAVPRARDMPALRELAIVVPMRAEVTRGLVDELGPQLELLDVRNDAFALRFVNELKTRVAGELLVGKVERSRRALLRVERTTQRSWWDHVTLE
jgi:hypothetical protein